MKKYILLILWLVGFCFYAKAQTWILQTSEAPSGANFRTVFVESANYVVAGGNDGANRLFKKTLDGGVNWFHSTGMTMNYPISDLYVEDDYDHFAVTTSYIMKTNNPDGSWAGIYGGPSFNKFHFRNADTIIAVGSLSGMPRIELSRNGGFTWDYWGFGVTAAIGWNNVFNAGENTFIISSGGKISRNNDAFATTNWTDLTTGVTNDLHGIHFISSQVGFVVGNGGVVLKTTNGGNTWSASYPTPSSLRAVTFVSATEGWAVGLNGTIIHTTDAGNNWSTFTSPTTEHLMDVDFLNPFVGYAVGFNGTIIKFQDNCTNTNTFTDVSCGTYYWGTNSYTTTGTYTQSFINQFGCDSAVTLNLTVYPAIPITDVTVTACDSFIFNSHVYNTPGLYMDTLTSVIYGCDSLVRTDLSIVPGINTNAYISGSTIVANDNFGSYTVQWVDCNNSYSLIPGANNSVYTPVVSGDFAAIITSPTCGSDTTACIEFCMGINNSISISGTTVTAAQTGATYQWVDCNNGNTPLVGATSQSFTASVSGDYAVEITMSGCTVTSPCIDVIVNTSVENSYFENVLVYPNPAKEYFIINGLQQGSEIKLYDLTGKLLLDKIADGDNMMIHSSSFHSEIYILLIIHDGNMVQKKLVVE